MNEIVFM